jgi:hypothetical protein
MKKNLVDPFRVIICKNAGLIPCFENHRCTFRHSGDSSAFGSAHEQRSLHSHGHRHARFGHGGGHAGNHVAAAAAPVISFENEPTLAEALASLRM